jgi:predicted RNA-binding protein with PIN domain
MAAEKELRAIFEKTYGPEKKTRYKDKVEKRYREGLSEEEEKALARRNLEIKARHARTSGSSEDKPVLILVDGYNLIFADEYLEELSRVDMGSARDQLVERLSNFAGYRGCDVSVVFDAYRVPFSGPREEEVNGVSVIFTSEDEPADILMGKMTSAIKDRQIYVVSSDALVQQDALGHGSLRIASREFLEMLSATEDEIRKKIQRNV